MGWGDMAADPNSFQEELDHWVHDGLPFAIYRCPLSRVLPLRACVLRPGKPVSSAFFEPDDSNPLTRHLAALQATALVGCVSLAFSPWQSQPSWRLRGMATHPAWRGQGIGTRLVQKIELLALQSGPPLIWCTARQEAISFYQRNGWEIASDLFEIEAVGLHRKMTKIL